MQELETKIDVKQEGQTRLFARGGFWSFTCYTFAGITSLTITPEVRADPRAYDGTWDMVIQCPPAAALTPSRGAGGGTAPEVEWRIQGIDVVGGKSEQTLRRVTRQGRNVILEYKIDFTSSSQQIKLDERLDPSFVSQGINPLHFIGSYIFESRDGGMAARNLEGVYIATFTRWQRPCVVGLSRVQIAAQVPPASPSPLSPPPASQQPGNTSPPAGSQGADSRSQSVQTREDILTADIQRELIRVGLYDGSVDGVYGPRTRRGIEEFQRTRNVRVDGLASAGILTLLRTAPAAAGAQRQQQEGMPRLDEAAERRRREEAELRQAAEARAAADLAERRRQEVEARAHRDEEERRRREAAANLNRQAADAARLEQERLRRERDAAEEARRAAVDELRRVTALRQELEADLQAAREAQAAAMRQPPTPAPAPPNAGASPSALAEARAAPTPFSDDFGAVNSSVGCLSSEPAARRGAIFRERHEGKEFAWTGRVRAFFPSLIELDMGTGRSDVVVSLVSGQEALPITPGQRISIRFTMTQIGTCSAAFRGQRGVILSIDGTSLR